MAQNFRQESGPDFHQDLKIIQKLVAKDKFRKAFHLINFLWYSQPKKRYKLKPLIPLIWERAWSYCRLKQWNEVYFIFTHLIKWGASTFDIHFLLAGMLKIAGKSEAEYMEQLRLAAAFEPENVFLAKFFTSKIGEKFLVEFIKGRTGELVTIPPNKLHSGKIRNVAEIKPSVDLDLQLERAKYRDAMGIDLAMLGRGGKYDLEFAKLPLAERIQQATDCKDPSQLKMMIYDPSIRIFRIILENPTVPDSEVVHIAKTIASQERLAAIAENPKWHYKYPIKMALLHNPRLPARFAQHIVRAMGLRDLLGVLNDRATGPEIRKFAQIQLRIVFKRSSDQEKEKAILQSKGELLRELGSVGQRDERLLLKLALSKSANPNIIYNMARSSATPRQILTAIAGNPAWNSKQNIIAALVQNPSIPRLVADKLRQSNRHKKGG